MTAPPRGHRAHGGGRTAPASGRGNGKEIDMGISDWIAAALPYPEEVVARADAWFVRHPVLGGLLAVGCLTGILPALVLGYLL